MQVTHLQPISGDTKKSLQQLTDAASGVFHAASAGNGNVVAALEVAEYIGQLRGYFDSPEIKSRIVALQDTALGFRTDKDPTRRDKNGNFMTPYEWPVVRDASIEATLRGLQLVGNQFNIIAGRFYATKEGFEFLLKRLTGLSEFNPSYAVPKRLGEGAIVDCVADWVLNNKPGKLSAQIAVKTDSYSGTDQIIGKASRKFMARCYGIMTGVSVPDGQGDDEETPQLPAGAPDPGFTSSPVKVSISGERTVSGTIEPGQEVTVKRTRKPREAVDAAVVTQPQPTGTATATATTIQQKIETTVSGFSPELYSKQELNPKLADKPTELNLSHVASRTGPDMELKGNLPPATVQDHLADFVTRDLASTFDAFKNFVERERWYTMEETMKWDSFDEIGEAMAKAMICSGPKRAIRAALQKGGQS